MPLIEFICPDGEKISIDNCLSEGGCRMGERCATRSYLRFVSRERKWKGKPSTTQLIRGSREAYLLLTTDYAVSPDSRAFMIHGTKGHANLESATDELSLLEVKFDGEEIDETGIADIIETENGKIILADYKTSGSYKVAKALGFKTVEKESEEIYKTGKRKGEHKKIKELVRDIKYEDRWEWELQLNKYRIEWEKNHPKIDHLKIQCIVRDGGTYIARSRGVFRNVYYFNVRIMPDAEVLEFFKRKREALLSAIETGFMPPVCEARENWDGLKCSRYCSVADHCSYGKYLKTQKQSEEEMIKGLSEIRRLPRLGKIRLGIKKVTAAGKEYPAEIDYFRLDPKTPSELENKNLVDEFTRLYGEKPKQIKIMFPLPDPSVFFPQFYKRYANGVLRCKGDGTEAVCISKEHAGGLKKIDDTETGGIKVECNGKNCVYYKENKCSESAALSILLPELKGAGVWEIVTGSFHSIVNINSCLEYIRALCGRVHMIPLTLERRAQDITYEGHKATHYILHINMDFALADLQKLALVDATRILLDVPEPEVDKEDILFQENAVVNPEPEVVETLLTLDQVTEISDLLKAKKKPVEGLIEYLNKAKETSYKTLEDVAGIHYDFIKKVFGK